MLQNRSTPIMSIRLWRSGDMFKRLFIWLFDKRVLEAINNGATYNEVKDLVRRLSQYGNP